MQAYKLTYYTEIGYCRRSIKEFASDPEIAEIQADTWLRSVGLDLYKIEIYNPEANTGGSNP